MGKEIELDIILLPPQEIRDIAIDMSRKLHENFKTHVVLDTEKLHPHITLYQARFPEKNLETIQDHLKIIANKIPEFEVSLSRFSAFWKSVWWEAGLTNEILHASKSIIYQLNFLREGLVMDFWKNGNWNMSETYNIRNYGSMVINDSFFPHITITTMENVQDVQKALQILTPRITKFTAKEMQLGTLGKLGTVTEILDTFTFKG